IATPRDWPRFMTSKRRDRTSDTFKAASWSCGWMKIPSIHFPGRPSLGGFIRLISFAWLACCAWIPNSTTTASADSIKIGAVLPFSGGVELCGRQAKLGLDLAAKEINASGGILGRPLEIIYQDDQTDPAIAVKATNKLIE